jgi:hypothetical protein
MAATASRTLTSHSAASFACPLTPGGSFMILCKLTMMAVCTDIELLAAALLRAATKTSLVFGSDVRRGKKWHFLKPKRAAQ